MQTGVVVGWIERNLNKEFSVAAGIRSPAAYNFADDHSRHVVYLGGQGVAESTGVLHELYCGLDNVWHDKALQNEAGGPLTTSAIPPAAYMFILEGTQHVLYQSTARDNHLWEMYWDNSWHANDLSDNTGVLAAISDVAGFETDAGRAQVVIFPGPDQHVHVLTRQSSGDNEPSWVHHDLTSDLGGPPCTRGLFAYAFEGDGSLHINYQEPDDGIIIGHIWEYVGTSNLTWSAPVDISGGLNGPTGHIRVSRGFGFLSDGTRHLPVVDSYGQIWEYVHNDQWAVSNISEPLGAPPVQAPTLVASYAFEATHDVPVPTQHMIYAGEDGLIHELWRESGAWQLNTLTGAESPRAVDSPSAFTDFASSSQNVYYISDANEVVELRWTPGGIHLTAGSQSAARGRIEK